jgi:hypothetical protein
MGYAWLATVVGVVVFALRLTARLGLFGETVLTKADFKSYLKTAQDEVKK